MSRGRRVLSGLALLGALGAFAATSPPSAYDHEEGEATLDATTPALAREVGLDVDLQGAFGSETVDFSCGLAWREGAEPAAVRASVERIDDEGASEPQSTRVLSDIGTKYDDGSRTPGPHALVRMPVPCEGDAKCSARYRFRCELAEPDLERSVDLEWNVSARIRYDPGGFCGDARSTLDLTSTEVAP